MRNKELKTLLMLTAILIALIGTVYFLRSSQEELPRFAVKNPKNIRKIVLRQIIKDKKDKELTFLKLPDGTWTVNGFPVEKYKMEVLLETLGKITIRERSAPQAEKNFLRFLKEARIEAEIESNKEKKVLYIGTTTPDGNGTLGMLKGDDRVFVLHIPGFAGTIAPRFAPELSYWRDFRIHKTDLSPDIQILLITRSDTSRFFKKGNIWFWNEHPVADTVSPKSPYKYFERGFYAETELKKIPENTDTSQYELLLIFQKHSRNVEQIKFFCFPNSREHYVAINGKKIYKVQKFLFTPVINRKYLYSERCKKTQLNP